MNYPRIQEILNFNGLKITVRFNEGTIKEVDLSPLLSNEIFGPFRNDAFIKQGRVDQGGFGIIWNEDIDISEAYLWDKGQTRDQIVV